jgi:hypothetical protein
MKIVLGTRSAATMTSRNRVIAVFIPSRVVCSDSLMALIITVIFVPAKLRMNWASAGGISALPVACDDRATQLAQSFHTSLRVENGGIGNRRGPATDGAAAMTPCTAVPR